VHLTDAQEDRLAELQLIREDIERLQGHARDLARLAYLERVPVGKVAESLGVSRMTLYRWLADD